LISEEILMKNISMIYAVFRILAGLGPRGERMSRRLQRFSQNPGRHALHIRDMNDEKDIVPTG
jgi:hypothetical protein